MASEETKTDNVSTQYKVVINGLKNTTFRSCEGLESEIDVLSYQNGGNLSAPVTARGFQKTGRLSFGRGAFSDQGSSGKSLFDWYLEVCDSSKALKKETILVILVDSSDREVEKWEVVNAWPSRWMGPLLNQDDSQLSVQYITFAHEGIKKAK